MRRTLARLAFLRITSEEILQQNRRKDTPSENAIISVAILLAATSCTVIILPTRPTRVTHVTKELQTQTRAKCAVAGAAIIFSRELTGGVALDRKAKPLWKGGLREQ